MLMTQMMRWFGPGDPVPLAHIRQAGATEVVTALHDIPNGAVWDADAIAARKRLIADAGLGWTVVDNAKLRLSLKGGPAFRHTSYRLEDTENVITALGALDGRWSMTKSLTLNQHAETFIATDNSTFASTTAVDARILGALSARLSYTIDYQTSPPVGAVDLNTLSRASLVYDF